MGSACMRKSRSSNPHFATSVSPSSRRRTRNLPRTRKAGVPNEVPSSTPGSASMMRRTVSNVTRTMRSDRAKARSSQSAQRHTPDSLGSGRKHGVQNRRDHRRNRLLAHAKRRQRAWHHMSFDSGGAIHTQHWKGVESPLFHASVGEGDLATE